MSTTIPMVHTEHYGQNTMIVCSSSTQSSIFACDIARMKSTQGDTAPFAVMDASRLIEQMSEWRRLFPYIEPFYAIKCNSDRVLLQLLADMGAGFVCTNKTEIDMIVDMGSIVSITDRIIYTDPCKTRNNIKYAAFTGINALTFDCEDELHKIKMIHPNAQLILRINVIDTPSAFGSIKYGCDPLLVAPSLLALACAIGIDVIGISFHIDNECINATAYSLAIAHARRLFDIGRRLGHNHMNLLDIGGGFPGHYTSGITISQMAELINMAIDEHFNDNRNGLRIIAEPGRYFASAPFTLVTNVIGQQRISASRFTNNARDINTDAFVYYMNDGVYGSFNSILRGDHNRRPYGQPLFNRSDDDHSSMSQQQRPTFASILGPTFDSIDVIVDRCRMRRLNVGEWIRWDNMGAYTTLSSQITNEYAPSIRPSVYYFITDNHWQSLQQKQQSMTISDDGDCQSIASEVSCIDSYASSSSDEL